MNEKKFGLSVEGSTEAAVTAGKNFEKEVGDFSKHINDNYIFTKDINLLPDELKYGIKQFFALSSKELKITKPIEPKLGDIYKPQDTSLVETFTSKGWKVCKEGILPDYVLVCKQTSKAVLIEVKYGDTEGNAHIERAGARATPNFLSSVHNVFKGKARYLYIFSGPMVTARHDTKLTSKVGSRGSNSGSLIQNIEKRRLASVKYHRQMEVLFGSGTAPVPWDTLLWDEKGLTKLVNLFNKELSPWLLSSD